MDSLTPLSPAWQIADAVRTKRLSAAEITEATLARIAALNPALNAFVYVDANGARAQAAAIDARVAAGEDPGLLAGVPIGVKDLDAVAAMPLTSGSRAFADRIAAEDSVSVARLRAAGVVILGKTNTPEFGFRPYTDNLLFGATGNPWAPDLTSGGSSGGSASAIAAGMVPLCTASDGGGSIRIPASLCGCFGLKPSAHRIPRAGEHASHWGTFSTLGALSWNVRDTARYLDVAAGPHPNDMESLDGPTGHYEAATIGPAPRLRRIGWSADLGFARVEPEVRKLVGEAARALADAVGAELVEAHPDTGNPGMVWFTAAAAGDAHFVDTLTDEQRALVDPGFLEFSDLGRRLTGVDIAAALEGRHQINRKMTAFFERFDLLLAPVCAALPFVKAGPPPTVIDGEEAGPAGFFPFTSLANVTGHPAASVPAGLSASGLPVGMQIIGPRFADVRVLQASASYEAARPWSRPPMANA